ncbi:MAG: M23 family metallopeptidase [Lachnospiraceae bacterium]|nr:M23 family metallopeptidase [Lachnospiraceae bacterium]
MKKRSGKSSQRKEKLVMIASTALVLSALTVTGVYVRNGNKEPDGGYTIDFSSLEESNSLKVEAEDIPVTDSDLDYDPASTEAGSTTVQNNYNGSEIAGTGTEPVDEREEAIRLKGDLLDLGLGEEDTKDGAEVEAEEDAAKQEVKEAVVELQSDDEVQEASSEAVAAQIQPELIFSEADSLVMPLVGNVLINYSADKSVYFPTLKQYKCNPALVIEATQGASIKAAAPGMVSRIYNDPMTGQTVVMTLGNGYELTYGQLKEVTVSEGAYVAEGEIFAQVAEPTRYFTEEGCNLYLKLTKDGTPVNPIG